MVMVNRKNLLIDPGVMIRHVYSITISPALAVSRRIGRPFAVAAVLYAFVPLPSVTGQTAPQLQVPVACTVGVDCWIMNYFDRTPGPQARDYKNGYLTYNGHTGVDFAVRDLAAMAAGVAVIAAADGTVRARRDGMEDAHIDTKGSVAVGGRECGNGVVIDHAPGWATQYCHLRKGSVRVRPGQPIKAGDILGFVGLSGFTEFPHLHFNVLRDGAKVDPFGADDGSGLSNGQLWSVAAREQMPYRPTSIYAAGFREAPPEKAQVKLGNIGDQKISPTSPAIVFWTGIIGVRTGDTIVQTLHGPADALLARRSMTQTKNQIRRFAWIGKQRGTRHWPAGEYIGRTTVTPADGHGEGAYTRETRLQIAATSAD